MEQLSSCYFCGGALDASLDEYPVVPKELHPTPDDQKTVVLCQGCRQKLGTVVETVVAAVDDTEPAEATDEHARNAAESSAGDDQLADDGWVDAGELSSNDDSDAEPAIDDGDSDDGSGDVTYTTSTAAGGRKSVSGNAESIRDDGGESGANGGETASTNDGGNAMDAADGDGGAPAEDGPSLTALENTKVMRLLQNRAFPVDRAEIRTVAINAYDISESEFDTVIDAAIDRGLIGEENGQIVEGE